MGWAGWVLFALTGTAALAGTASVCKTALALHFTWSAHDAAQVSFPGISAPSSSRLWCVRVCVCVCMHDMSQCEQEIWERRGQAGERISATGRCVNAALESVLLLINLIM